MNSRSVSRREAKANRDGFLFSLPWLIGFLLFSLYPIVMSAYYSFTDFSAIKDPVWVGLKNYQDLLKDKLFWQSLQNTILYVVISVPVTILVSLLLAALLKVVRVGKALFRSVFFLPSIFPVVASTMIWLLILDSISGYLNRFLNLFGIPSVNWLGNPAWTKPALVIMTCWGVGSTVVILLAAMGDVSHELYEAASIDGAGTWKQFIHITLPGISHVLDYQVILDVINGIQYLPHV